ncbi:MAG: CbiX/SirB N-terminal domain-containing protein [Propionibacteriaceae bacterium]|nr:CbiX/SirB N-terminal domain-containing protein [Propionibacteriaceae bacterium]
MTSPLVIAVHGTRVAAGQAIGRAFVDRVRGLLPGVDVRDAYVELDTPTIDDAVVDAATAHPDAPCVVVPLMLGVGGHVREDIPHAIAEGRTRVPGATVVQTPHLGPDARLRAAVVERIGAVLGDGTPAETGVVFLGRGCSVTEANADHARLARVVGEEGGFGMTVPAYIQVVRPSLTDGLDQLYACGFRRLVVSLHYMFAGRLQEWAQDQAAAWAAQHPGATVRVTDVIGDCDALAQVVVDRYRAAAAGGSPVYLAGLDLRGRRVLVAGAGRVVARRIPALLAAGADLEVVATQACPEIEAWAASGRLTLSVRAATAADVEGAWYVLAATDDPDANAQLAEASQAHGIFCVRADDAEGGTARTPASGTAHGLSIGVIGDRDPHLSARARDIALAAVSEGCGVTRV